MGGGSQPFKLPLSPVQGAYDASISGERFRATGRIFDTFANTLGPDLSGNESWQVLLGAASAGGVLNNDSAVNPAIVGLNMGIQEVGTIYMEIHTTDPTNLDHGIVTRFINSDNYQSIRLQGATTNSPERLVVIDTVAGSDTVKSSAESPIRLSDTGATGQVRLILQVDFLGPMMLARVFSAQTPASREVVLGSDYSLTTSTASVGLSLAGSNQPDLIYADYLVTANLYLDIDSADGEINIRLRRGATVHLTPELRQDPTVDGKLGVSYSWFVPAGGPKDVSLRAKKVSGAGTSKILATHSKLNAVPITPLGIALRAFQSDLWDTQASDSTIMGLYMGPDSGNVHDILFISAVAY